MRVGIFGGSFDPVHDGHLECARFVFKQRNLDKLIFIPAYISPLKQDVNSAPPEHRIKMLDLAISGLPGFSISDFEIINRGVSYTFDTVTYFKNLYDEIDLIIGYDNLVVFEKWHKPDELLTLCNLIVLRRNTDKEFGKNKYFTKAVFLESPVIDLSSTEVRNKISNNQAVNGLVPEKVIEYIITNKLYI